MAPVMAIALYFLMIVGLLVPSGFGFVLFVLPFLVLNIGGSIYVWFSAIGRMDHHDASPMLIPAAIVALVVSTIIGLALFGWADTVVKGVISGVAITTYFAYLVKDEVARWSSETSAKSVAKEIKEENNRQEQKQLEWLAYLSSEEYRKNICESDCETYSRLSKYKSQVNRSRESPLLT